MVLWFEENFQKCLTNLNTENYQGATGDLYPISKRTASLGIASDAEVIEFAKQISNVVALLASKLDVPERTMNLMDSTRFLLMDTYRILRNSCGANAKVLEELGGPHGEKMMQSSKIVVDAVTEHFRGEILVQCLAVVIQFLSNVCVNSERNQDLVWDHFESYMRRWLDMAKKETDQDQERTIKILNLTSALIEVCLPRQWLRKKQFITDIETRDIIVSVIDAVSTFNFDFGKKVMAKVVQIPDLAKELMKDLTFQGRYLVCISLKDVIQEFRNSDENGDLPTIQSNLVYIACNMIMARPALSVNLLETEAAAYQTDLHQHVKLLEVVADASCCRKYAPDLINCVVDRRDEPKTVVMYALDFLNDIHKRSKEGRSMLSFTNDPREAQDGHPAYLLRRDLVRVIANLAYQNRSVQDTVREAFRKGGIPLLCEQVVIDARNPFLEEWAKLALTNLVRDNEENAKFMLSMKMTGVVTPSGILKDCGLTLEQQGDRVVVRSDASAPTLARLVEKTPCRP